MEPTYHSWQLTLIDKRADAPKAGIAANIIHLKESEYFLLGDNCAESIDSRSESVGVISASDILGTIIPQRVAQ